MIEVKNEFLKQSALKIEISRIFEEYRFALFSKQEFQSFVFDAYQIFQQKVIEENTGTLHQKFLLFFRKYLDKMVVQKLEQEETACLIILEYVKEHVVFQNNYESALQAMNGFLEFFQSYQMKFSVDFCELLLAKSKDLKKLVKILYEKHCTDCLGKTELDDFLDETIEPFLEAYLFLSNAPLSYEESEPYVGSSLKMYLSEINKPLLSFEEEQAAFQRLAEGDESAKKLLCERNLRLVVSVAKKFTGHGVELPDLIQEGNIGLMKAIDQFDFKKNLKFSNFAFWKISGAIQRAIENQGRLIRIPVYKLEQIRSLRKTERLLFMKNQREPTLEELASALMISLSDVKELLELSEEIVSLNSEVKENSHSTKKDTLEEFVVDYKKSLEEVVIEHELVREVRNLLENKILTERQRYVLEHYFGISDIFPETLEGIGKHFGTSKKSIGNTKTAALLKLRKVCDHQGLEEFLA